MPQLIFYILVAIISLFLDAQRVNRATIYDNRVGSGNDFVTWFVNHTRRRNRRISALKTAKNYLKPYEKIFGNLTLSNKFCTLSIYRKDKRVICLSKVFDTDGKKMMIIATDFSPMDIDEYFDMMCELFSYGTKYDDVYNSLRATAIIKESVFASKPLEPEHTEQRSKTLEPKVSKITYLPPDNLTDVNNCSEAELTALPGISIISAKKIIKYRETKRPFKSVEDFIEVMKIKPHFAKQLRQIICAQKVDMKKVKKAKAERIIDL